MYPNNCALIPHFYCTLHSYQVSHVLKLSKTNPRVGCQGSTRLIGFLILSKSCFAKKKKNHALHCEGCNSCPKFKYICLLAKSKEIVGTFCSTVKCNMVSIENKTNFVVTIPLHDVIWLLLVKICKWHLFIHLWTRHSQTVYQVSPHSPLKKGPL